MSAIAALREATQAQHRALEAMPLPARLMSPAVQARDYRDFLRAHEAVLAPWVLRCPPSIRDAGGARPAQRLQALRDDLAHLPREGDAARAPDAGFEWNEHAPAWWGAYYVIEGARLGARVVARHLRAHLPARGDARFAFLECDADAPWPHAVHAIETALPPSMHAAAAAGALSAFDRYREAFGALPRRAANGGGLRLQCAPPGR